MTNNIEIIDIEEKVEIKEQGKYVDIFFGFEDISEKYQTIITDAQNMFLDKLQNPPNYKEEKSLKDKLKGWLSNEAVFGFCWRTTEGLFTKTDRYNLIIGISKFLPFTLQTDTGNVPIVDELQYAYKKAKEEFDSKYKKEEGFFYTLRFPNQGQVQVMICGDDKVSEKIFDLLYRSKKSLDTKVSSAPNQLKGLQMDPRSFLKDSTTTWLSKIKKESYEQDNCNHQWIVENNVAKCTECGLVHDHTKTMLEFRDVGRGGRDVLEKFPQRSRFADSPLLKQNELNEPKRKERVEQWLKNNPGKTEEEYYDHPIGMTSFESVKIGKNQIHVSSLDDLSSGLQKLWASVRDIIEQILIDHVDSPKNLTLKKHPYFKTLFENGYRLDKNIGFWFNYDDNTIKQQYCILRVPNTETEVPKHDPIFTELVESLIESVVSLSNSLLPKGFSVETDDYTDKGYRIIGLFLIADKQRKQEIIDDLIKSGHKIITESTKPTDMNKTKVSISALASSIISNKGVVTQHNMNTLSNLLSKGGIVKTIAPNFNSINIRLAKENDFDVYLNIFAKNKMNDNFIKDFIAGRDTISSFIKRDPVIHVTVSQKLFKKLRKRDHLLSLMENVIKFYSDGLSQLSEGMFRELLSVDRNTKELISKSPLKGVVTIPLMSALHYNDIDLDKIEFNVSKDFIKTTRQFVRYATRIHNAPKSQQISLIKDLEDALKKEGSIISNEVGIKTECANLIKTLEARYNGSFDEMLEKTEMFWTEGNVEPGEFYMEFGKRKVKKLKKIPADLVPYILIEIDMIKDHHDRALLASYCVSRIELVEWYIELIDTNSKNYIVPHTREYLVNVKNQLSLALKRILDMKIQTQSDTDNRYPPGYSG